MRPSFPRLFAVLAAAPLMLASSAALAGPSGAAACANIELVTDGTCQYIISGCSAECTPPNLVAACSGQCMVDVDPNCTGGCQTTCEASCKANPGSFQCTGDCEDTCEADCQSDCTESACLSDCQNTCENQCQVSCQATPPSVSCTDQCQASCNASCTVDANIGCHEMCSVSLQGGCQASCNDPTGALFCDGQYVDLGSDPAACIAYLESQGLSVNVDCSITETGGTCSVANGLGGCNAAPGLGAAREPLGVAGIAGMVIGLGLVASRRRRRA